MDRPRCQCHDLPMWRGSGGRWECQIKRRDYNQRRNTARVAWVTEKRASDPLYRIASQLMNRRNHALRRMDERHRPEEERGQV